MTRPPRLRFAPLRHVPPGRWRQVPPAIFPPLLGLAGLALAWGQGAAAFALPRGPAELLAGATVALASFAVLAYGTKLARRPGVLRDELAVLPGRAGVAAGVLTLYLAAALLAGPAPGAGRALLVLGLACHAAFAAVLVSVLRAGPPEQRRVTPVWHLSFAGILVAAQAALPLGWPSLAAALFWPGLAFALAIHAASLRQLVRTTVPAPLRPLLAIHAAPLALLGTVAAGLGWTVAAWGFALAALALLATLAVRGVWLLASGFSPFWGALSFPLAATAGLWATLATRGGPATRAVAAALLVLATIAVPAIAFAIWRHWARGRLASRTNAAIA